MKEAGFISPVGRGVPIDAPICCKSEALSKKIVSPQRGRWQVAVGRKLVAKCRKAPGDVPN